ncbi:MAG: hypothetical protein ACRDHM_03100 [Actinomycetota bacterium]
MSKHRSPRRLRRLIGLALLLACVAVALTPAPGPAVRKAIRTLFGGVGAWVDIYDDGLWADPEGTIATVHGYGVRTLYLETCNSGCKEDIHRPETVSRWIEAAHAAGIRVVGWYLPEFDDMEKDSRRSLAAINFRSALGQGFDGFALDIESRVVTPVMKRNRRILDLSRQIRDAVGSRYPLGAITIPWFFEWGGPFPYAGLYQIYDAFLPMIYFGAHTRGANGARSGTAANIQQIRGATGSQTTPVHAIAGIADDLNAREVGAFVRTAQRRHVLGVSLYDFATSGPEDWQKLALWD